MKATENVEECQHKKDCVNLILEVFVVLCKAYLFELEYFDSKEEDLCQYTWPNTYNDYSLVSKEEQLEEEGDEEAYQKDQEL